MIVPVEGQTAFQSAIVNTPLRFVVGQFARGIRLGRVDFWMSADQALTFALGLVLSPSSDTSLANFRRGLPLWRRSNNSSVGFAQPTAFSLVLGTVHMQAYWGVRTGPGTSYVIASAQATTPAVGSTLSVSVAATREI